MRRAAAALILSAVVLMGAAPARTQSVWEREFRAEMTRYQESQACKPSAYNMRRLNRLRTEAARRGYVVRMNQIARETGWKQAQTHVLCANTPLRR